MYNVKLYIVYRVKHLQYTTIHYTIYKKNRKWKIKKK